MLPSITIIIPTLNSAAVLTSCLRSLSFQDYPKSRLEILVIDGGSSDETLSVARKYGAKIFSNPLKTGEAGKAVGIKKARGELVALIDSDNILPDPHWFSLMIEPFTDPDIIGAEPWEYTYRKTDPFLTRYFAMLGMSDPLCLFIGNYDRVSVLTRKWTNFKFDQEDEVNYLKVKFNKLPLPTIGANGTIYRRYALTEVGDYLFDIDVPVKILAKNQLFYFAKVKVGIVHTFVENDPAKFFRKQARRINDLSFHKRAGKRATDWTKTYFGKIIYFQFQCLLIFPILFQMSKGFWRKPDLAWLFHPVACYSTMIIYWYGWVKGKIKPQESSRKRWRQ